MSNLDEYGLWLNTEMHTAERELDWLAIKAATAYSLENDKEKSYWRGYYDAMNNAAAACYGPTPLDGEAN